VSRSTGRLDIACVNVTFIEEAKEVMNMALTRDFQNTVADRVERDPALANVLLDESATPFLSGEPQTARFILRDLVNATLGFGLA
jgi:ABC-type uncharacterized transport system YnjBCD substrate-binding protein